MQEPRANGANLQVLRFTEYMVNVFAESAKMYWRWWGPLGTPMIRLTQQWADAQRQYLKTLQQRPHGSSGGEETFTSSPSQGVPKAIERSTKEAERSARESAKEARRIAQEAKRNLEEDRRNSAEGLQSYRREKQPLVHSLPSRRYGGLALRSSSSFGM